MPLSLTSALSPPLHSLIHSLPLSNRLLSPRSLCPPEEVVANVAGEIISDHQGEADRDRDVREGEVMEVEEVGAVEIGNGKTRVDGGGVDVRGEEGGWLMELSSQNERRELNGEEGEDAEERAHGEDTGEDVDEHSGGSATDGDGGNDQDVQGEGDGEDGDRADAAGGGGIETEEKRESKEGEDDGDGDEGVGESDDPHTLGASLRRPDGPCVPLRIADTLHRMGERAQ